MDGLVRNTTMRLNPRSPLFDGYQPLDQTSERMMMMMKKKKSKKQSFSRRTTFSKRKRSLDTHGRVPSFNHGKRERARQRQIFLRTYKLASIDSLKKSRPRKLVKTAFLKLKRIVIRIVAASRIGSLGSCICAPAVRRDPPAVGEFCF